MFIFLSLPWWTFNGEQLFFLDIVHRKFTIFGITFWATDTRFLVILLGGLGISLFLFSSLLGRVWCGWACPETVFLEFLVRPIETLIEGDSNAKRLLDKAPWNLNKLFKKSIKIFIFSIIAWVLATTALAVFVGRTPMLEIIQNSPSNNWQLFTANLLLMGIFLFQFGWFREQFCTVLCPYARFQSVLLDSKSLVVGYDAIRGEPRGKLKESNKGDCIDCKKCIRVCPTGIDIRNGLQLECIHCAQCIDACDEIMTSINKPKGLIRYSTEESLQGKPLKLLRPRVVIYGIILVLYLSLLIFFLTTRSTTDCRILRTTTEAPYKQITESLYQNQFKIHLANKGKNTEKYTVVSLDENIKVISPLNNFQIAGGTDAVLPLFAQTTNLNSKNVKVLVTSDKGFKQEFNLPLILPDSKSI